MRLVFGLLLSLWASTVSANPDFWVHEFPKTNFSKTTLENFVEILSGGPGRDGIPAVDNPEFSPVAQETKLQGIEPVLVLSVDGAPARAYPLRYLTWHEIVNDEIAGVPIAVTFCPLCNTAIVFDRRLQGQLLTFGVTGKLRRSDMIMYDRETETWWQQATGQAIVGDLVGSHLTKIPARLLGWDQFRTEFPDGDVMQAPGGSRPYGQNPYVGYDGSARPFLFSGEMPPHDIPALARVVAVEGKAWPLTRLAEEHEIREAGLVLTWQAGQASALDSARISDGRDIGSVRVQDASGDDVVHEVMFAFAFHSFVPDGQWMIAQ